MRPKAKTLAAPLQQADFDALPDSVQRKYFSGLERLQIQQQSFNAQHAHEQDSWSHPSHTNTPLKTQRQRRHTRRHTSSRHNLPALAPLSVSQAQVDFFLSLPDKLQKLYYSLDEQQRILLHARRGYACYQDDDHAEWARQRFNDFNFDFEFPRSPDSYSDRGRPRSASAVSSSSVSPRQAFFPRIVHREIEVYQPTHPLDFDNMTSSTISSRTPLVNTIRRTMSLTASSVNYTPPGTGIVVDAPFYTATSPRHERTSSSSLSGRRSSHMPTSPSFFDPEATHYQDPEARKKLRMYLASPQKFDEAIEFGFPSTAGADVATPHYQLPPITSHARNFSQDMHTFLKDGKLSFLEDDNTSVNQGLESDRDSVAEDVESPTTPSSTGLSFRVHSRQVSSPKYSIESTGGLGSGAKDFSSSTAPLNREMTLRMTLTRPDLRADEDQLYGWQNSNTSNHSNASGASTPRPSASRNDDPLALEDLVLTDDMTGTKGAFYVKPKRRGTLVTRLLKRASLRGR